VSRFEEPVSSCVWAPDGQSFVTGCLHKSRNLCQWGLNGELLYDWGREHRIQNLAVAPNGNYLVAADHETHVHVYNFVTRELEYEMDLKCKTGSVSISQDSRYLLISKNDGETRMLDLETRETVHVFKTGERIGNNIIRASYGGANESFVTVGSESMFILQVVVLIINIFSDGHIFIWHKDTGNLIEKLDGHEKGCCSSISWNPTNPQMFASAGDDTKVRMYV